MAKKPHVPKFGDWDSDNISYTACFESARKNGVKGNPNDPEDNPEAFKRMLESSAAQPPYISTSSSSKPQTSSEKVRQTERDSSHRAHQRRGIAHEHRVSGGSRKSYTSESGSERSSSDYSLLQQQPRHHRARSDRKSSLASSGSDRSHSASNSQSKPKSTGSSTHQSSNLIQHDTHTRVASIPKFGDWDENDPQSGEGFTYIFERVKEEKKTASKFPNVPQQPRNNLNSANKRGKSPSKSKVRMPYKRPHHLIQCYITPTARLSRRAPMGPTFNIHLHQQPLKVNQNHACRSTATLAPQYPKATPFAIALEIKTQAPNAVTKQRKFTRSLSLSLVFKFLSEVRPVFVRMEIGSGRTGTAQFQPSVQRFGSKSAKKVRPDVPCAIDYCCIFILVLPPNAVTSIVDGLKRLYNEKLKPLELAYRFNDFASPSLTNSDFDAKPMVMLLGQYSTGKTTFIKHLLRCDYPGAHIGPEPTTDRFVVVMSGPDERSIPGNTIAVHADMPFSGLTAFGGAFLSKFECSQMPHPLLDEITFVDTPGVLSGEKQRTQRSYDFTGAISWFAAKCDVILLLFDPHKLDISDEFKRVISSLRGHDDKIRVVLNKADQVDTQQLMRVYGALMWSLGKVLNTPEVVRVYIGSFNDKPVNEGVVGPIGKELFEKEQDDLLSDLVDIPKKACDRRINEFVKRARAAKIHAYIMSHLKKEMPAVMGKSKAQRKLIENLEEEFAKVQRDFHLPAGDFPDVEHFREVLGGYSIDKFDKLKPKMIQAVDDMLGYDIPELLKKFRNPYN
ncbi:hypothetical protein C1H46_035864 [Malus baccata]|uniref:Dynamin-type G domain-containing protein n=1 Tax=Malus baccata TaxID=106549 RepID=A0A540KWN4_MALBA|nr:hypothetical protein C1H46_035864 [Malus baccata]